MQNRDVIRIRIDEEFVRELARQKKRVDDKIGPIKQSYGEGKITKIEFVEKLANAFHELEKENNDEEEYERKEKS